MKSFFRSYCVVLFLLAVNGLSAQVRNDSVFQYSGLAAAPLLDIATHKTISVPAAKTSGMMRLFVFLSPECPLCQNYTRTLNQLTQQYTGKLQCYGIIPGRAYKPAEVAAFAKKYHIHFPLWIDGSMQLSRYLQATVTPEVILLSGSNELIYKGAIDNWLKELGKQRVHITENYLADAIGQALKGEAAPVKRTKAIGCMINDF